MSILSHGESSEDPEVLKQRLMGIVGEEFDGRGAKASELLDRDIAWRLIDAAYGSTYDIAGLQITGNIEEGERFKKTMEEEGGLARLAGHILKINTGYKMKPVSWLLVLDVDKNALKGLVNRRTRNVDKIGLHNVESLPIHEVDMRELIQVIRAA